MLKILACPWDSGTRINRFSRWCFTIEPCMWPTMMSTPISLLCVHINCTLYNNLVIIQGRDKCTQSVQYIWSEALISCSPDSQQTWNIACLWRSQHDLKIPQILILSGLQFVTQLLCILWLVFYNSNPLKIFIDFQRKI